MDHMGLSTLCEICKHWYSNRKSKHGAFDDLIVALLKTKSTGRLVLCVRLPSCEFAIYLAKKESTYYNLKQCLCDFTLN